MQAFQQCVLISTHELTAIFYTVQFYMIIFLIENLCENNLAGGISMANTTKYKIQLRVTS